MTVNDALSVLNDALGQNYRPNPYPEMVDLLQYLKAQGVVTGVISASPSFVIYPLAETLQYGIPLENSVGIDVLLQDPAHPENKPLRLSRLVLQGKSTMGDLFGNYQDVLSQYGSWTIVDAVPLLSAQAGKGMQARAIARRYVALYNRDSANAKDPLDIDDMRLLMFAGDNFAPQTDIPLSEPERPGSAQEMGNDQGLSEGLPFLEKSLGGTDILYIQRFLIDGGKIYGKTGVLGRFKAYLEQQNLLRSPRVGQVIIQPALTDLKPEGNSGGFLKEMPQVSESQPSAESLPHVIATPVPESKPTMTPPPAPKPFGPLPAEGNMGPDTGPAPGLAPVPPSDLSKPLPPAPPKLEPLPPGMGSKSDAL